MKISKLVLFASVSAFVPSLLNADAALDAGKKTYEAKCASCHGKDGKGNPTMSKALKVDAALLNLTSPEVQKDSDSDLLKAIAAGKNKMPAYSKQLPESDQKAVLAYIRSLAGSTADAGKPADKAASPASSVDAAAAAPVATTPAISEAVKKEYEKSCASCHGKDGKGNAAMAKAFKVDPSALDLTDDGSRGKPDAEHIKLISEGLNKMPACKGKLPEKMIADIVAYYRSLK